ncbi:phospholipase D-like domain-containing protein [Myxococcus faecalis]|uniref:phospholipase D-like domain-containing protein n=1 Tax=Myxococcus faecalis TaxID=3115646 RepID=UPI003CF8DC88
MSASGKAAPRFLDSQSLWPTLVQAARAASGRRYVATAYLGDGASSLLPLRRGDVLLCALTPANARAGSVYPSEVRTLLRKGVRVFVQDDLHAKVYHMGRSAIVCSANLSHHSRSVLDEAGVLLRGRESLAEVRAWFKQRMGQPVQPEWLAICERAFRPPSGGGPQTTPTGQKVWIVPTKDAEFPTDEQAVAEQGAALAQRQLQRPQLSDVEKLRRTSRDRFFNKATAGDLIIQVYDDGKRVRVYPHGKLLHIKHVRRQGSHRATYVYVENPKRHRLLAFAAFEKACAAVGFRPKKGGAPQLVRDRVVAQELLLRTSPERLRK